MVVGAAVAGAFRYRCSVRVSGGPWVQEEDQDVCPGVDEVGEGERRGCRVAAGRLEGSISELCPGQLTRAVPGRQGRSS